MIKIDAKRIIGPLILCFGLVTNILAQNNPPAVVVAVHEKIYIHFDKPYYTAGETIWFKAYLYNSTGLPAVQSIELYIQLENQKGKIITRNKYAVSGASASGAINLDESIPEGYYKMKAITRTVAMDDPGFMYTKNIFVYNASQPKKDSILTKKISLQFFPESGNLIDRIKTQVAFKATDERGNPLELNGIIKSDSGTLITAFRTYHDGIGRLSFTPHFSSVFIAEVDLEGKKYVFPLPKVQPAGVYLKISATDSGKVFEITRSKTDKDFFDTVKLVVKMNNDTVYENVIPFGFDKSLSGMLKTKRIPSGILHFIVLNKNGVPMAERLAFVNNREYILPTELVSLKRDSSKRGANSFEIRFKDSVQRSFSIAVTDIDASDFPDKENLYSRLLLTSDLKGDVYNPGFYFEKDNAATQLALDNLMLTHGWTRYNWKKKTTDSITLKNADHYLIGISGNAIDLKNRQRVHEGTLNLQIVSEDSSVQSFDVTVDKNGTFKQDSLLFYGNSKLYFNYTANNGNTVPVILQLDKTNDDDIFSIFANRESWDATDEKIDTSFYDQIALMPNQFFEGKYKLLSAIAVKAKTKRPSDKVNEKYASSVFNSSGRLVLDNINTPYNNGSLNVMDYIITNIRGVEMDPATNILVNKKNFSLQSGQKWKVELLLDESSSTVTNIRSINMSQVAMIKFYEAGFIGVGSNGPGGAVAVYLKKDTDFGQQAVNESEKFVSVNGYSVTQEFYHPDYSRPARQHSDPDNRATLYWNPDLKPGNDAQSIKFSFFNNDVSKKINIVIEGFDARGRLLHYEKTEGE